MKALIPSLGAFLDVIYPCSCLGCAAPRGSAFRWICDTCSTGIERVQDPCCLTCGYPFHGMLAVARLCPHCHDLSPSWSQGRTLALYSGPTREMIQHFKYRGARYLIHDIRVLCMQSPKLMDWLQGATLVPVPLHKRKLRERGYNQSLLIARMLADEAGGTVADLLQRVKDTQTQTRLSREKRARNMRRAFSLRDDAVLDPSATHVVVDDVFTTGATLNACCDTLAAAGVSTLRVLTLAHG